ncbi:MULTISPECIES: DNA polymerase II [unclassified Pseudoalteromonas]|uniref:DNA polymerase II n=1 Tax=unclassified Pseudoalteromonas TaxID=194690 RepID=UPI00301422E1
MTQAIYQGFVLSRQQLQVNGQLRLCYWLKSSQGLLKAWVEGEQALFFIKAEQSQTAQQLLANHQLNASVADTELKHFDQSAMVILKFTSIKHYYEAKQLLSAHMPLYEEDIRHCDRYLMERFIRGAAWVKGRAKQKNGFIEIEDAQFKACDHYWPPLTALSLDIECNGEGVLFSIGLASEGHKRVLMIGEPQPCKTEVIWVADEIALLQQLEREISDLNPDVIIGWNVIEFDFAVLADRADALGLSLRLGRDGGAVSVYRGNYTRVLIPGRVVLDGIDMMKNATYHYETFKLSFVAEKVLGTTKLISQDDRLEAIINLFHHDKPALAAYNLRDCELVLDIFSTLNLLEFALARTQLTGLELEKMGGSVAAFTNLYLPLLHRSGYIAPNLSEHGLHFDSPGGYVMDSKPGLYKNILVLDFKSLYPSIIRTFCIDPMGLIEGLKSPQTAIAGFNQGMFSREHHHLPELVRTLSMAREQAKHNGDRMLSQAIKIIMNSLYGVLGSKGCRFYDPRLSSSITMRGHQIMQLTKQWIEAKGYEVIYGDTDSTFVSLPDHLSQDECQQIGRQLSQDINRLWQQHLAQEYQLESHLEIEFETHYSPFFMPTIRGQEVGSKKRYVGQIQTSNGPELVFKGMESVRSDWTDIAKEYQQAVIRALFDGEDLEEVTKFYINQVFDGKVDEKLVFRKRLGKSIELYTKNIPPQVKAAKQALAAGELESANKGSQIPYYLSLDGPVYASKSQLQNIDYAQYIEKQILPIYKMLPNVGPLDIRSDGQKALRF